MFLIGPAHTTMCCGRWSAFVTTLGFATTHKRVLTSEGNRRADLEIRNIRVVGQHDLLVDVTSWGRPLEFCVRFLDVVRVHRGGWGRKGGAHTILCGHRGALHCHRDAIATQVGHPRTCSVFAARPSTRA
jgi:hypothetical protein